MLPEELSILETGTQLRAAIDAIRDEGTGALLIVGDEVAVEPLCDGGAAIDQPFSVWLMVELARGDGAIMVSEGAAGILKANVHLHPDRAIPTSETGIRHRTAERVARQTGSLVVAISATSGSVTAYKGDARTEIV
jgi:diadenylate cyclase